MLSPVLLLLGASALSTALPSPPGTAVSPDGYTFVDEKMVTRHVTLSDGTTGLISENPHFKLVRDDTALVKRLTWRPGGDNNKCGASSINGRTSGGSPSVDDCAWIRDFMGNDANSGHYEASWPGDLHTNGDWTRLQIHGSCVFGIKTRNSNGAYVGSTDIRDLIRDAINQAQADGRIGAEGNMGCDTNGQQSSVDWAIFHS